MSEGAPGGRGRLRGLLAFAIAGAIAGAAWGLSDEPRYAAEASVLASGESTGGAGLDPADPDSAARLLEIARSRGVAEQAARILGGDVAGADLLSQTEFRISSGVLTVRSTAGFPDYAAAAANAYADAVTETTTRQQRRRLESARDRLTEELAQLDPASPEAIALTERVADLGEQQALGPPLQAGAEADLPDEPDEDRPAALWALGGALAGGLAGALAIAAPRSRRRGLRSAEALAAASGLPVLADLPRLDPSLSSPGPAALTLEPALAEQLELLSDGLDLGGRSGPRTLAVFSAGPKQGRSSLALGLAAATAARGARVLVVEADMRSPSLAARLGIAASPGLADYLAGAASPREVLQTVTLPGLGSGGADPFLACVPAGGTGREDAELLDGERFARLVERVGRVYDVIIFDTPPLLRGREALTVARTVEANLLCARASAGGSREVRRAAGMLDGTESLGAVLVGATPA